MPLGVGTVFRGLFREYGHTIIVLLRVVDAAMLTGGGLLAYYGWHNSWQPDTDHRVVMVLGLFAAVIFFEIGAIYRPWRADAVRSEIGRILRAWLSALALVVGAIAVIRLQVHLGSSYRWLATWGAVGFGLMITARLILAWILRWMRSRGWSQGRIVIVGLNTMAIASARQLNHSPWAGLQLVGYVDDRAAPRLHLSDFRAPRLGGIDKLADLVTRERIDEVWVAFPFRGEARAEAVMHELRHLPVSIRLLIDCFAFQKSKFLNLSEVAGIPTLNISVSPLHGINRYVKEFEDRLAALFLLLLVSPVMALIALGVKLSSRGPVFYRQVRVGWNNQPFTMLKFRSMPVNAESASGPVWARPGESRATPFGAFLRRTSLDELPQLLNVLWGDMSLVGPRPERPDFVERFKDEVPNYMKKHMVKAGITGWAQVNGWRGDTDLATRIEHDLYYIQHWSLWFDLEIALKTVVYGFVNKNAY